MYCCSQSGSSTTLPKKRPYATDSDIVPIRKLRRAKSRRSTIGCLSVSSHAMKNMQATTATMPSVTICPDANQSSSLPLSIITCMQPTKSTSSTRPT